MDQAKKTKRIFLILNCLALGVIAMNLTAPVHEVTHLLTQMAAGLKPQLLAFGVAGTIGTPSVDMNSFFWKVMLEGSAALMNILIGTVLLIVLKNAKLGPLSRPLVLMTTIMHYSMGFGYFLRDFFLYDPNPGDRQQGDWAKVLERFNGSIAPVLEKASFPYLFNAVVFTLVEMNGPVARKNMADFLIISPIINIFGMIGFFWGYMFVAHMVKPPKKNVYYFSPCAEKKPVLWIAALAVLAFDAFLLCPGFYF